MMRARSRSLLVILAGVALVVAPAFADGFRPPPAPDALGPFAVGHTGFDAVDPHRDQRTLAVQVWYPVDREDAEGEATVYAMFDFGIFVFGLPSEVAIEDVPVTRVRFRPLVIFSHGGGGINIQSFQLMETLASHGFIAVAPNHTGSTFLDDPGDPIEKILADRPRDVSFLIDLMLARAFTPGDPFFLRINPFAIGVTGHSIGGVTAIFMAAGSGDIPPDPRVRAIMPIAGVSSLFVSDEQLEAIGVPTFILGGTLDALSPIDPESIRAFELVSAPFVYRADIEGATHTHFAPIICDSGQALIDLGFPPALWPAIGAGGLVEFFEGTCVPEVFPVGEVVRIQNLYAVSFFRRHLDFGLRYVPFLTEEYAEAFEPAVTFFRKSPALPVSP